LDRERERERERERIYLPTQKYSGRLPEKALVTSIKLAIFNMKMFLQNIQNCTRIYYIIVRIINKLIHALCVETQCT